MKSLDRCARLLVVVLMLAAWTDSQAADFPPPADDGWYGWQVEGTDQLVRIYVKMSNGAPSRLRINSSNVCRDGGVPEEFADLGIVDNAASIAWLKSLVAPHSDITEDALFALVVHDGDEVIEYFDQLISNSARK